MRSSAAQYFNVKFSVVVFAITLLTLSACGGGGGDNGTTVIEPPVPVKTGIIQQSNAEQIAVALVNGFQGIQEAQAYPMFLIIGDLVSADPTTANPQSCLGSGSYNLDFVDSDGSGNISAGESSDVIFSDCHGSVSAPVNGGIRQDLIAFDADFPPNSIFASTVRRWNARYTYTNFSRFDIPTQETSRFNGEFLFDYALRNDQLLTGWTMATSTMDLSYSNSLGTVLMRDVAIDYTHDDLNDSLHADLSGTIESSVGPITIDNASLIHIANASTSTPDVSGFITVRSQFSTLSITMLDMFLFNLSLDTDNDGVFDFVWQYSPVPAQVPNTIQGDWNVYVGGNPSPTNAMMIFNGVNVSYQDDSGEAFGGTFADTSTATINRLQITLTRTRNSAQIGLVGNCIYQFDTSGFGLTLACNDPGAAGYPADFTAGAGVEVFDLSKQ